MRKNAKTQSGRPMRKYAGSCGTTTVWPKRRRDPDNFVVKRLVYSPNYLLTILEQGEDTEDTLAKMEQVMAKYCAPRNYATEELQSLDEGSEKQNDWRSLLFELSPTVRTAA